MKIKTNIFQKLLLAMVTVGTVPMILFSLLTVVGYEDIIKKQNGYIVNNPILVQEANLNALNIRIQTLLIFLLGVIFIIFFSIVLTRKFLYPIKDLIRGTKELKKGKLKARITINTNDEFESLAESFNSMAEKLDGKINELNKERRKLEEERNKISAIISNFIDPIIALNKNNRLSLFNPAAKNIFGVSEKSLGKKISPQENYSLNNFREVIASNFTVTKKKGIPNEEEMALEGSGGQINYKVITVQIRGSNGRNLGLMKIFYNLTREKAIDRMKTEFISIAAHQLRTPLSAIKWSIKMVLAGDMGQLNEEQRDMLNKGYQSNERMIRLVNDLLNVSRIEEGRFGYAFKKEDFINLLDEVLNTFDNFIKTKNIKLSVKTKPDKQPFFVYMDKDKIAIVLQNIIDNAIKYTSQNGKIKITVNKQGKHLEVAVEDSGVGIPKEDQKKIFSKFFRAKNVVRMQTEGSGLGLFIAKNIIEKHGGKISIKSAQGKGTKILFYIPIKKNN